MNDELVQFRSGLDKTVEHFKKETSGFRVGRATPALVENIFVDAYGTLTPLMHLANINVADPKTLTIQTWDKSLLKNVEKALQQAELGVNPIIQGDIILINIPAMTEETRRETVKKLYQHLEEAKVTLKGQREKAKEQFIQMEKDKEMSEDDKFKVLEDLDTMIKDYSEKLKDIAKEKEDEIMKI